jgi:hypothetical protein
MPSRSGTEGFRRLPDLIGIRDLTPYIPLEPKKGIPGVGMVGIEDTFVVTPEGGRSLTETHPGLPLVEGCPASSESILLGLRQEHLHLAQLIYCPRDHIVAQDGRQRHDNQGQQESENFPVGWDHAKYGRDVENPDSPAAAAQECRCGATPAYFALRTAEFLPHDHAEGNPAQDKRQKEDCDPAVFSQEGPAKSQLEAQAPYEDGGPVS